MGIDSSVYFIAFDLLHCFVLFWHNTLCGSSYMLAACEIIISFLMAMMKKQYGINLLVPLWITLIIIVQ